MDCEFLPSLVVSSASHTASRTFPAVAIGEIKRVFIDGQRATADNLRGEEFSSARLSGGKLIRDCRKGPPAQVDGCRSLNLETAVDRFVAGLTH